jgi:hypothetical protein
LELGELHFAEGQENVIFAGEVIEERAFADVGDVGYVFDGGFHEALFSEELEGSAEETFTDLCAAPLTAVWRSDRLTWSAVTECRLGHK